jgi:hypothetical protein
LTISDPQDHSERGSDPDGQSGPDPGAEARRFWGEYSSRTRSGSRRESREAAAEAGDERSSATPPHQCLDWCPICRAADVLRSSAPPELRDQLQNLQRDTLVTLRELLDSYIEHLERSPRRRDTAVEEIPIE